MASSYFCVIVIFLVSLPFSLAQSNGNIGIDSSLTAGDGQNPWISASGDFAFGFKQLQENEFLLSIWFNRIPEKTVVWHANISTNVILNPVLSRGSKIQVDASAGLILRDPRGVLRWHTDSIVSDASRAFLDNTGNLVLFSRENTILWESFQYPTDTLLPSQELEIGRMLISRRSEPNFSQGRFYIEMEEDGNFITFTKDVPNNRVYDNRYTIAETGIESNPDNPALKVVFDDSALLSVLRRNNQTTDIGLPFVLTNSDYYHRITLNFDGVLTQYYYPRSSSGNANWTVAWSKPDNICHEFIAQLGNSACGYNSICTLNDVKRPGCNCPNGYSLVDPNDEYGNCQPDISQSCEKSDRGSSAEHIFDFHILNNTDWPISDMQAISPSSEAECKNACLNDCLCSVAIFRSLSCWKKRLPLSNGRIDNSLDSKVFLKYRKSDAPSLRPGPQVEASRKGVHDCRTFKLTMSLLLGSSVTINVLLIGTGCLGFYLIYKKMITKNTGGSNSADVNLRCFTFIELDKATNGFKEELGRGAFGVVFKGVIPFGFTLAVKKLDSVAKDTEREFRTEVNVIGQTHHKNLVRLIGFCDEGENRLLVYEYMRNGTLASFLFGDHRPSWSQMQEDSVICMKNVLNQSRTNTGIRGTKGYVAPEWFKNTQISTKVDVFSFGVVLFETITCRRNLNDMEVGGEDEFFVLTDWGWDCYQNTLESIQENASSRPTMRTVSQMLQGIVEVTNPSFSAYT
ncbi:hypothetical protein LIER_04177 [Lithospermum erythrorhizon]|uniref:Receptor-like serine/threonine-protein kinase n=1 Tax=Lithospermum erythrorhizon TaxID=34254 RepID=A0AAV3NW93_LITER